MINNHEVWATCQQCGTQLNEGDKECPNCGSTTKTFDRRLFTAMGLKFITLRAGQKRTGFKGYIREIISRWKPSVNPGLRNGVFEQVSIDKETDKWDQTVRDAETGDITHEEHVPLSQHRQKIRIDRLKVEFKGKPFNLLIKHHLKHQNDSRKLREATVGTLSMLPQSAYDLALDFIDRWNLRGYDSIFWRMDTSEVFTEIVEDARTLLSSAGISADDEILFNMFQIVVLSYAYSALDQPKMRKFIGI